MAKKKPEIVVEVTESIEVIESIENVNSVINETSDAFILDQSNDVVTDLKEPHPEESDVVFSKNYFESEILFKLKTPNPNIAEKFDFTNALIDLSFITGIERAVLSRLEELGLTTQQKREEYDITPDIHPFVYSKAYPNGVLILDVTYDELKTMLVKYKS